MTRTTVVYIAVDFDCVDTSHEHQRVAVLLPEQRRTRRIRFGSRAGLVVVGCGHAHHGPTEVGDGIQGDLNSRSRNQRWKEFGGENNGGASKYGDDDGGGEDGLIPSQSFVCASTIASERRRIVGGEPERERCRWQRRRQRRWGE